MISIVVTVIAILIISLALGLSLKKEGFRMHINHPGDPHHSWWDFVKEKGKFGTSYGATGIANSFLPQRVYDYSGPREGIMGIEGY